MKNFLIIITLFFGITAFAQVGIGTTDPKTTLDVEADVLDNTKADAVMVPRLTAAELQAKDGAYLAAQNGALVFVESGTGGTAKTANVTGTGFYYYDAPNSVWFAVGGGSGGNSAIFANSSTPTYNGENVIIDLNTGAHNFTLPNPANYKNKIIFYRNASVEGGGGGTATFLTHIPPNNTTVLGNRGMVFYSDGTVWRNVGGV